MAKKFRKKPVVIEALQWTGENVDEAKEFLGEDYGGGRVGALRIITLEGIHMAKPGWWLIRGVEGEHYACEPGIFEKTYEVVE